MFRIEAYMHYIFSILIATCYMLPLKSVCLRPYFYYLPIPSFSSSSEFYNNMHYQIEQWLLVVVGVVVAVKVVK